MAYTYGAEAVFIELPGFERRRERYLDDEGLRSLQSLLMRNPLAGLVVPDTGGLRKLRFADRRRGKGTRGGLRVLYYWWQPGCEFWLFTLFDKDELGDLGPVARAALKTKVKEELKAREGK
ncbi:MAG: toxin [Vicinamibacteria bacterium]